MTSSMSAGWSRCWRTVRLAVLALWFATAATAQLPLPLGLEQLLSINLLGDQDEVASAVDGHGNFVFVWRDSYFEGLASGIYARRFDGRTGQPFSEPKLINFTLVGDQRNPAVAAAADGHFVVIWEGPDTGMPNPVTPGIWGSLLDPNGDFVAGAEEFQINQTVAGTQRRPAVAMQPNGAFFVAWQSPQPISLMLGTTGENILGRSFPANFPSSPPTNEFPINQTEPGDQEQPAVAPYVLSGGYLVAWQGPFGATPVPSIVMRLMAPGGTGSAEIALNTTSNAVPRAHVALATNALGNGVAVWEAPDFAARGIYGRLLVEGFPAGSESPVNLATNLDEREPSVAIDAQNDFVITWVRGPSPTAVDLEAPDGSPIVIQGRRKSGTGGFFAPSPFPDGSANPEGAPPPDGEFQVNTLGSDFVDPSVVAAGNGNFAVAWQGTAPGIDPEGDAAFFRRFAVAIFADGFGTGGDGRWSSHFPPP